MARNDRAADGQSQNLEPGLKAVHQNRLADGCGFGWRDADKTSTAAAVFELDVPGNEREQSIIFALADIFARLVLGAALANQNRASIDQLASEALYAEPLAVRIAAVC